MSTTPDLPLPPRWRGALAGTAIALLAGAPIWSFFEMETAPAARGVVAAVLVLSALSPFQGLLACAALLPLAGPTAALLRCNVLSTLNEPLAFAFLSGWGLSLAATAVGRSRAGAPARRASPAASAALLAAAVLAVVAVSSAVVGLFSVQPGVAEPPNFPGVALRYLSTGYFHDRGTWAPMVSGMWWVASLGLYSAAVVLVGRDDGRAVRLFSMVACGAAGVSALNVVRLLTVWLTRGGRWDQLIAFWRSLRITSAFTDLNAAGSYLAMAVLVALGLGLSAGGQRERAEAGAGRGRAVWLLVLPLLLAGLWLTGSRAALLAASISAVVLAPAVRRSSKPVAWSMGVLIALALVTSVPFAIDRLTPSARSGRSIQQALNYRIEMNRAAVRMIADQPVFGVGVGMFQPRSSPYINPVFRGWVPSENAHNNFLQVLAELGFVGFVPFLALLLLPAVLLLRSGAFWQRSAALIGAAAGLLAFIITWLAGHPLLIYEVATAFWITLGAFTAAVTASVRHTSRHRSLRRAGALLAAGLVATTVLSVPLRGLAEPLRASFDNLSVGLSRWKKVNGERLRTLQGERGRFYVPADATSLRIPLRLSSSQEAGMWVDVEVRLDGALLSLVRLTGPEWRDAAFTLPPHAGPRPFWTVQVEVGGRSEVNGEAVDVQLGEPQVTLAGTRRLP